MYPRDREVLKDAIWRGGNPHLPRLAGPHPDTKGNHAETTVHIDARHHRHQTDQTAMANCASRLRKQ